MDLRKKLVCRKRLGGFNSEVLDEVVFRAYGFQKLIFCIGKFYMDMVNYQNNIA